MELIGYTASLFVGIVLGLIGAGGSMLIIPVLIYLFSIQVLEATSYSLVIIGLTSSVGAIQRFKKSCIDLKIGLFLGMPSIISMFLIRKWILPLTPDIIYESQEILILKRHLILLVFSLLIFTASYIMITKKSLIEGNKKGQHLLFYIIQGAFIGLLTGFVGIGGGFLIIPVLIFIAGLPFEKAVGTSLFIIAIKSLTGFSADLITYNFNWVFLLCIVLFTISGIFIGNYLSFHFQTAPMKRYFGWFTLLVGISVLLKETLIVFQIN